MNKAGRGSWKTLIIISLLAMGFFLSGCESGSSDPQQISEGSDNSPLTSGALIERYTYVASNEIFPNPERGFYGGSRLLQDRFEKGDYESDVRHGRTLVAATVRLDDYRQSELPASLLNNLEEGLASLRNSPGIKVLLRFAYNGCFDCPDANKNTILKHISQLKPIFNKYSDVIAYIPAGFIGSWGEWHHSTNRLMDDPQDSKEIIEALLDALPESRMVQIRYPFRKKQLYDREVDRQLAYSGEYAARIGHHNDCFLAIATEDEGYLPNSDASQDDINKMKAYIRREALYTPVGGESCIMGRENEALQEMEYLRWTYINVYYHPDMISYWRTTGDYEVMQRKLGYRFLLHSARISAEVKPGNTVSLQLALRNDGWANLYNPRPVYVVFDNGTERFDLLLEEVDPRWWSPGEEISLNATVQLPAEIPNGRYKLALWLPDESEHLRDKPGFSIRFANEEIWSAEHGYNVLGEIDIDSDASS